MRRKKEKDRERKKDAKIRVRENFQCVGISHRPDDQSKKTTL
jgi:hypothetical protein